MRCLGIACYVFAAAALLGSAQAQQRAVDRNLIAAARGHAGKNEAPAGAYAV
jgi:hypothetical protein